MTGLPTSLTELNLAKAGQSGSNNPTNKLADALNYYGLKNGTIGDPSASTIQSAKNYSTDSKSDEHPILSANGSWVSSSTGQPWHGAYNNPNGSTQYYSNGKAVNDIGQIGNQLPDISVQQIQKNPALSSAVQSQAQTEGQQTQLLNKSFNDYLNEANNASATLSKNLPGAISSIDPTQTINRLNADTANAATNVNNTLNQYQQNQQGVLSAQNQANQNYQNTQNNALTQFGQNLAANNSAYATAAQNVANQAYNEMLKRINLYQLTSSTPTSGSGNLDNRYLMAYENVNVPLQQDLANRALNQTNTLYNLGSNLQNQYLQNQLGQLGNQSAFNSQFANMETQGNQYLTGLDQNTANQIQSLRQQVAGMQPQIAMQYLQAMGIPMQTAQAIISGNNANLAQLLALDQQANTYNYVTPYQNRAPLYTSPRLSIPSTATAGAQSANSTNTGNTYGLNPALFPGVTPQPVNINQSVQPAFGV